MLIPFRHNTTSISVFDIAEKTGLSVEGLISILGWADNAMDYNGGYLTRDELKYVAKQYVYAVKQLQKSTRAKIDRLAPSRLEGIRKFLESFVRFDFLFSPDSDALYDSLDEERIERHFYNLIYGEVRLANGTNTEVSLQLRRAVAKGFSLLNFTPEITFRSCHFYTYPDEEDEDTFYHDRWSYPLAA